MRTRRRSWVAEAARGGAIAGVVAGIVLSAIMLAMTSAAGKDPWYAVKGAGAPFLGARAMMPGFDALAVTVGVLGHLAVSAVWGILFGMLFYGLGRSATVAAGLLWGIVVWIGMYYVVLPIVGQAKMVSDAPVWRAIMFHEIFSVALALAYLPFQVPLPPGARPFWGRGRLAGPNLP